MLYQFTMRRSTALVLLVGFVLAGCTPWLQALSGVQPHACCLRRLGHHPGHQPQISSPVERNGNCCPPLTTPHSALLAEPDTSVPNWTGSKSSSGEGSSAPSAFHGVGFSNRAPPS